MLYQVTGPAGSGKTEYLYAKLEQAYRSGRPCVWIAPEQQSVQAEREILERLGDGCNLSVEILNFERLPERVARSFGDLAVTYPDKGALCALLSVLTDENRRNLQEYGDCASDTSFLEGLFGLFGRLRSERIRPEQLRDCLPNLKEQDARLGRKLSDVALLYEAYDAYFDETKRDPRDALSVLSDELASKPFFVGKTVFVDGYYTFTGQEFSLLTEILKQADEVYCSFTYDGRELFSSHEKSAFRLKKQASGQVREIPVGPYRRSERGELKHLERYLWADETPAYPDEVNAVQILEAEHAFSEAEAVAAQVLKWVREGYRYRDITVMARHVETYAGILDAVFAQNHIPFFFSEKDDLQTKPLCSFVCASLELIITDFSLHTVKTYLKSGYSVLSAEECDVLLRYAESWKVRGGKWYDGKDFTNNPDGYLACAMTEQQQADLNAVNEAKRKLFPAWNQLREALGDQNATGKTLLNALYDHLQAVGAPERFTQSVNDALSRGETEQAAKDSQLWELLMRVWEHLETLCGQTPMAGKGGLKRMLSLLKLTISQYSLGAIPSSLDSVTVGEAALCRPDRAKAVVLMGCNDGVFPASVGDELLFDDAEMVLLEGEGVSVALSRPEKMQAERVWFYQAVAAPSEQLLLTYPTGTLSGEQLRPSPAVLRIRSLLPDVPACRYTGQGEQALFSAENALTVFASLPDGEEKETLRSLLSEKGLPVPDGTRAVFEPQARITYPYDAVRFSPSSVERYRYCPFSYFGNSLLRLKEKKTNRFSSVEIGTFLHAVLERFLRMHTACGRFTPPDSKEQLERETDALMNEYFASLHAETDGKRFLHTCRNLRKTLLLLLEHLSEELAQSDFLPIGFEVGIGLPGSALPALSLPRADGKQVLLYGVIDRVDRYDADGASYIRVVDYKTYAKSFSLSHVQGYGLDEQMLLYLFAYCAAAGNGQPLRPAGVLYDAAILPFAEANEADSDEQIRKKLQEKLTRSGLILEDTEVALAMDRSASGNFVPIKFDADGAVQPGRSTLSAQGFDELRETLTEQLLASAGGVLEGRMDVIPVRLDEEHDACRYCKLRPVCRYHET